MLSKLIIFLISFLSVISSAISIGQLNITCLNICVAVGIFLLFSMKQNTKTNFLLALYLGCSIEISLLTIVNAIHTGTGGKEFKSNFCGIVGLIFLGYFIIKLAQTCKTILFTMTLILNSTTCYHGFKFEYLVLQLCLLILITISNGRSKHKYTLKEKIILFWGIIGLCTYNLIFIVPLIVFILSEKYSYVICKFNNIYNLRYVLYICILVYLLFIQKGYLPQELWSNLWSSFENVFNFYPIYTALILAYALLNFKNKLQINSCEMLSILLLINIFLLLFNSDLWENDIFIAGEIMAGIFTCIPKINLEDHEWTNYMLISYGIALTGIYMLNLNITY